MKLFRFLKYESEINKARNFHKSFPEYSVTPLVNLDNLSEKLGVGSIFLKDESYNLD